MNRQTYLGYLRPVAAVMIAAVPVAAHAQDAAPAVLQVPDEVDLDIAPIALPESVFDLDPAVLTDQGLSEQELADQRGGTAIVVGNQTLTAVNSGGVINGDFSAGSVSLADNALTNFNGFGNLVINTGAQNNLQSGMNVTINFTN